MGLPKIKISWKLPSLAEKAIIIILLLAGLSFNFPIVKEFIQCRIFDGASDTALMIYFFSAISSAIVWIVFRLGEKYTELIKKIEDSKIEIDSKLFYKGTNGIYDDVEKEISELIAARKKIEIDILGFTLFSIKTKFSEWKNAEKLQNMTFNLFYINPEYIKSCPDISDSWQHDVNSHINTIQKFIEREAAYLKKNRVKINLYPFSHVPAVHGFKLHNSSIYIALAFWDENNILNEPNNQASYIKIENSDKTNYAIHLRKLFENWAKKAKGAHT